MKSTKSLIISISLVLLLSTSVIAQNAKQFVGTWNGEIEAGEIVLEIIITLSLDEENNIEGTIDVPMQQAEGIELGEFVIEGKNIEFMILDPDVQGDPTFNGELDETGKKIEGTFTQGGNETTFSLEKEEK
ncbi:MAG: hypothetical protein GY865_18735 [candidate division Zixibacteria bacterium]|nr:hypothetical protein [candidate division Zixibacteria bacterium]